MRRRLLKAFEQAELETDPDRRKALLTFVIIGGGPTGVELAGAIIELARFTLKATSATSIRRRTGRADRGRAAHSADFKPEISAYAERALKELGVEVSSASRSRPQAARRRLSAARRIRAGTVIWAAGVLASRPRSGSAPRPTAPAA